MNILTYGTFDLIHKGHLNVLNRAKQLGSKLIVGVSTDEFNLNDKNKICIQPYEERKAIIESLRFVDLVIPENNWEQKVSDIKNYDVDIFVIGDDWKGKFDYLKDYCDVVYLPRTQGISSTQLKQLIKSSSKE